MKSEKKPELKRYNPAAIPVTIRDHSKIFGVSLIEILIVLMLIGFFALVALPGLNHFYLSNQANTQVNQIISALHYARSEAILRGEIVVFCPSHNQVQCGGNWREGQLVMTTHGKILQIYPALNSQIDLIWRSTLGNNDNIRWLPSGFTAGQSGSFFYCPPDHQYAKRIVVLRTGRIRINSSFDSSCP